MDKTLKKHVIFTHIIKHTSRMFYRSETEKRAFSMKLRRLGAENKLLKPIACIGTYLPICLDETGKKSFFFIFFKYIIYI